MGGHRHVERNVGADDSGCAVDDRITTVDGGRDGHCHAHRTAVNGVLPVEHRRAAGGQVGTAVRIEHREVVHRMVRSPYHVVAEVHHLTRIPFDINCPSIVIRVVPGAQVLQPRGWIGTEHVPFGTRLHDGDIDQVPVAPYVEGHDGDPVEHVVLERKASPVRDVRHPALTVSHDGRVEEVECVGGWLGVILVSTERTSHDRMPSAVGFVVRRPFDGDHAALVIGCIVRLDVLHRCRWDAVIDPTRGDHRSDDGRVRRVVLSRLIHAGEGHPIDPAPLEPEHGAVRILVHVRTLLRQSDGVGDLGAHSPDASAGVVERAALLPLDVEVTVLTPLSGASIRPGRWCRDLVGSLRWSDDVGRFTQRTVSILLHDYAMDIIAIHDRLTFSGGDVRHRHGPHRNARIVRG